MSTKQQIEFAHSLVHRRSINQHTDDHRQAFLEKLHHSGIRLGDWTRQFVDSLAAEPRESFSPAQRDAIDVLHRRYGHRL